MVNESEDDESRPVACLHLFLMMMNTSVQVIKNMMTTVLQVVTNKTLIRLTPTTSLLLTTGRKMRLQCNCFRSMRTASSSKSRDEVL